MRHRQDRSSWSSLHTCTAVVALVVLVSIYGTVLAPALRAQQIPAITPPPVATVPLVLDGITVIDVATGGQARDQRVVIVGHHIDAVGQKSAVSIPNGATVVKADGKYLIPGLWDMHTHAGNQANAFNMLFIANGVTGIRDAGSVVPLDKQLAWRREIAAGTRVGPPRQLLSGISIDICAAQETMPFVLLGHLCIPHADSAVVRQVIDSLTRAGADILKTYWLDRETYFIFAAEARRRGMIFGGHLSDVRLFTTVRETWGTPPTTPMNASAIEASDSGARFIDHPYSSGGLDTLCLDRGRSMARCSPVADHFRQNGTWWVPTLIITSDYVGAPLVALRTCLQQFTDSFFSKQSQTAFRPGWLRDPSCATSGTSASTDTIQDLDLVHRTGLPIVAGTDVVGNLGLGPVAAGFSLHSELAVYVRQGLTPLEALQSATLNPAKAAGRADSLGTVAAGKLADLVVLDADPLQDITNLTNIRAVVADGRYYDRAALDEVMRLGQTTLKLRYIGEPEPEQEPQP